MAQLADALHGPEAEKRDQDGALLCHASSHRSLNKHSRGLLSNLAPLVSARLDDKGPAMSSERSDTGMFQTVSDSMITRSSTSRSVTVEHARSWGINFLRRHGLLSLDEDDFVRETLGFADLSEQDLREIFCALDLDDTLQVRSSDLLEAMRCISHHDGVSSHLRLHAKVDEPMELEKVVQDIGTDMNSPDLSVPDECSTYMGKRTHFPSFSPRLTMTSASSLSSLGHIMEAGFPESPKDQNMALSFRVARPA